MTALKETLYLCKSETDSVLTPWGTSLLMTAAVLPWASEGSFCPNPANTYWMLNITQMRNDCKANGIASGIANIYAYNQMYNLGLSTLSYSWPVFKKKRR